MHKILYLTWTAAALSAWLLAFVTLYWRQFI